jgi:5-formyltetrahydrofolate cyclo-ligase
MLPLVTPRVPSKAALRSRLLAARAAHSPSHLAALGEAAGARLLTLPEVVAARTVAGYVGAGTEPPTLPWLDALRARGVAVLLPLLRPDSSLDWGAYDGVLVDGRLGLREPPFGGSSIDAADVVVVPGVAYDSAGNRLGRGGGSYDRALSSVTALVVGLALDDEVVGAVPVEEHDRPVDVVVTPARVLRVRR